MTHDPMREALEAAKKLADNFSGCTTDEIYAARKLIDTALTASAPKGEPVAYAVLTDGGLSRIWFRSIEVGEAWALSHGKTLTALYTSPPPAAGWDEAIRQFNVEDYVADYEFRGGECGDHVPTNSERALITDAIRGAIAEIESLRRESPAPSGVAKADEPIIGGTAFCGHGVMAAICEKCNRPDAGGDVRLPQGYALVPTKPTPAMIEAGCEQNPTQWNEGTDLGFAADVANDVYVAMVRAAALSTPSDAGNDSAEAIDHRNRAERLLNAAMDHIAGTLEQPTDPRAWEHLLVYCPAEIVAARVGRCNASAEARLREALEPFVKHYEPWMERLSDDDQMCVFPRHSMGDLRRARQALSAGGDEDRFKHFAPDGGKAPIHPDAPDHLTIKTSAELAIAGGDEAKKSEGGTIVAPYNPCLAKLRKDEPFFVLLGRDKQAPTAVIAWADARERAEGKSGWTDEAREVAATMVAYSGATLPSDPSDRRETVARWLYEHQPIDDRSDDIGDEIPWDGLAGFLKVVHYTEADELLAALDGGR